MLVQLARGVLSAAWPYAAHTVLLYARHLIAEDDVALGPRTAAEEPRTTWRSALGPRTAAQEKAREAQRIVATEYDRVCEGLRRQRDATPTRTDQILMESICKVLPLPREVHVVPNMGS